jgi:hypothetical protein
MTGSGDTIPAGNRSLVWVWMILRCFGAVLARRGVSLGVLARRRSRWENGWRDSSVARSAGLIRKAEERQRPLRIANRPRIRPGRVAVGHRSTGGSGVDLRTLGHLRRSSLGEFWTIGTIGHGWLDSTSTGVRERSRRAARLTSRRIGRARAVSKAGKSMREIEVGANPAVSPVPGLLSSHS